MEEVPLFVFYLSLGLTVSYLVRVLLRFFCCQSTKPCLGQIVLHSFLLKLPLLILLFSLILVTLSNRVSTIPCFSAIDVLDKLFLLLILCFGGVVGTLVFGVQGRSLLPHVHLYTRVYLR